MENSIAVDTLVVEVPANNEGRMKTDERRKCALIATLIWLLYNIVACVLFQNVNAYFNTAEGQSKM